MTSGSKSIAAIVALAWACGAQAQELTVQEIKSKGGKQLAAEEVKTTLSGATLRYDFADAETQVRLKADGSLDGVAKRRVGSTGGGRAFSGTWNVTDEGRWCVEVQTFGQGSGGGAICRDVFRLEDKYFYAVGNPRNDARRAIEMSVSK